MKVLKTGQHVKPAEPRDGEVITKEYSNLISKAGALQFQISITKEQLATVNSQLAALSVEYTQRVEMNKQNEKPVVTTTEESQEGVKINE